jgi:hypothetical protein
VKRVFRPRLVMQYSSDSGPRRITRKFLDASPSELPAAGVFRTAARAFAAALNEARQARWQVRET